MLDHILGNPSPAVKRAQVVLWVIAALFYIKRDQTSSPRWVRHLDANLVAHLPPWKIILGTITSLYVLKNGFLLAGMNAPDPLVGMYNRDFYRATWIMTAFDAGFWTAMNIRPNWLKHILSMVFTMYYLVFADQAAEKVRSIRSCITLEHMRIQRRVELTRRDINLPPVGVEVFFNGTKEAFASATQCILHVHGGGHEDYLRHWAIQTGVPIFSIDYKKAPEFPYPYAIEECFDVYQQIRETNGACLGLEGWTNAMDNTPKAPLSIVGVGDSAGGNLITALTYKIIESPKPLVPMAGLLLIYPSLDFNIRCWLEPKNADLVRNESAHSLPTLAEARDHMGHKSPLAFAPDTVSRWRGIRSQSLQERVEVYPEEETEEETTDNTAGHIHQHHHNSSGNNNIVWKTGARVASLKEKSARLMMTSQASYISDRILTLDMLRAMVIMYLGPHRHPDFEQRDPLVDDSIRFAARIRQAKLQLWKRKQASSAMDSLASFNEDQHVRFKVIEGSSHGFLQLSTLYPATKTIIRLLGGWLEELLYHGNTTSNTSVPYSTGTYSHTSNDNNEQQSVQLLPASSITADERQHIEHWQKSALIHEADLMDRRNQHIYETHVLPFGQNNVSTV
ncbi:Alpha/Beta hydrolase protein [Syncephalis plumigaleata]|nr:Alpha/Beta hydrolase protein [Syncephalis plumigaleata]